MTGISALSAGLSPNQRLSADAEKANLDYNAFLRLFIASMKNQDPTQPNDPAQTLSQLASFSNVEQSIKLNDKLDALLSASNAGVAAALIGKTISSLDDQISGSVLSVSNTASGLIADLESGESFNLADGYKIKAS